MPNQSEERLPETPGTKVLSGWRRWLPFFIYKRPSGWKLHISPTLSIGWMVTLILGGYLAAGTALYWNDRYRHNLTEISWFDRIYPPNWSTYRQARGLSYIHAAEESLAAGNFPKAFHQLRSGLARYPDHREGRLLLSEMFMAANRPDLAQNTLQEGLPHHGLNRDYLERTVRFLFARKQDDAVARIAHALLPKLEPQSAESHFLAMSLANALYFRGRFDQAEDVLRTHQLVSTPDGRFLAAKIEWDRGFTELAMALIDQLANDFPANAEVYRTQVRWLIEQGEIDSARRASLLRRIRFPAQAQPRIDLLYAFDKAGEEHEVSREADALLHDFGSEFAVVLQVGDFAANTGRVELASQVLAHATQSQMPLEGPTLILVESLLVSARYQEALVQAREALDVHPEWEERLAPVFNGLRAICYFALGDREDANLFLNSYLELREVRAENLVAVAERLLSVGADREARQVLDHAVRRDPLNQAALTRLIGHDLAAADAPELPTNVTQLLAMRRAAPQLLRAIYDRLGEDRFIFVPDRQDLLDRLLESLQGKATPHLAGAN